jgi:hypothetical protein
MIQTSQYLYAMSGAKILESLLQIDVMNKTMIARKIQRHGINCWKTACDRCSVIPM